MPKVDRVQAALVDANELVFFSKELVHLILTDINACDPDDGIVWKSAIERRIIEMNRQFMFSIDA